MAAKGPSWLTKILKSYDRWLSDYKNENLYSALKQHCPKGIDVYFDNVGGEILDIALAQIRRNARIVICGAISQYNSKGRIYGPSNYLSLLVKFF